MGRGHHKAMAIVVVLMMRRGVGVGRGIVGAVDHESDMVTASRFEAIARVVSKCSGVGKEDISSRRRDELRVNTYSRMKGIANSRVISGSSMSGVRRRH